MFSPRIGSMAAMAHSAQTAHGHMQDHEGHVRAVEADLEYWRTKRLEPRLIQLHRRGVLTLYDLIRAAAHVPAALSAAGEATHDMESRIRALEDELDEYIRGVALASIDSSDYPFVIEDTRKERGDYDEFFRIAKPPHASTLTERIARLEHDLREYQHLLDVLMRALIDKGVLTMQQLERQRAFLAGRGAWNGARIVAPARGHRRLERGRAGAARHHRQSRGYRPGLDPGGARAGRVQRAEVSMATAEATHRFQVGERVRVMQANPAGSPRTPAYVRGKSGIVTALHGSIENPLDHRGGYPPLCSVL